MTLTVAPGFETDARPDDPAARIAALFDEHSLLPLTPSDDSGVATACGRIDFDPAGAPTDALAPDTAFAIPLFIQARIAQALGADHADTLLLEALMTEKPSQAAALVATATGLDRKRLYARALELKDET